jgi:ATP-dependent Clp protease adaptor protein ClpS
MTSTITRKTPRVRPTSGNGSGLGDPWRVVVLNDNHNTFEGVAFALAATLPGITYERGLGMADRIHETGSAVVWSGHRELAELYWSRLRDQGLTMGPLER